MICLNNYKESIFDLFRSKVNKQHKNGYHQTTNQKSILSNMCMYFYMG
nr:MAG TPA: centromere protein [Caudoviricetes sp.]